MLSLIKQAQQNTVTLNEQASNLSSGLKLIASTYKEDVNVVTESIRDVLIALSVVVKSGHPIDQHFAHGPAQTLAAYMAGLETLSSNPNASVGVRNYLGSVAIQNGQITNMNMVAKVGQIGNEKNQARRNEILQALELYNTNPKDPNAAQAVLNAIGKIKMLTDKIATTPAAPAQQTQPNIAPAPAKPVMS